MCQTHHFGGSGGDLLKVATFLFLLYMLKVGNFAWSKKISNDSIANSPPPTYTLKVMGMAFLSTTHVGGNIKPCLPHQVYTVIFEHWVIQQQNAPYD